MSGLLPKILEAHLRAIGVPYEAESTGRDYIVYSRREGRALLVHFEDRAESEPSRSWGDILPCADGEERQVTEILTVIPTSRAAGVIGLIETALAGERREEE